MARVVEMWRNDAFLTPSPDGGPVDGVPWSPQITADLFQRIRSRVVNSRSRYPEFCISHDIL